MPLRHLQCLPAGLTAPRDGFHPRGGRDGPLGVMSEIRDEATGAFIVGVYVTVAEELVGGAASQIAAFVPRRAGNVPAQGQI